MKALYAKEVLKAVYHMQNSEAERIADILKASLPNYEIGIEIVRKMKEAAQIAYGKREKEDYIIEKGEIIMNSCTGARQPGSRWKDYVHEMLEIKHGLKVKETSVSYAAIDQYVYFNKYEHLTGLTGTIGNEEEKRAIREIYGVKIFKVLKNIEQEKKIKSIPRIEKALSTLAYCDILNNISKGRPVLVIFNYIDEINDFAEELSRMGIGYGIIDGQDAESDKIAIDRAREPGRVTVATIIAGRGTDIKVSKAGLKA